MPDRPDFAEAALAAIEDVVEQLRRIADALEGEPPAARPRATTESAPAAVPPAADEPPPEPPPLEVRTPRPDDWRFAPVAGLGLSPELRKTLSGHGVAGANTAGQLHDVSPTTLGKLDGIGRPQIREIGQALKRAKAPPDVWRAWQRFADR